MAHSNKEFIENYVQQLKKVWDFRANEKVGLGLGDILGHEVERDPHVATNHIDSTLTTIVMNLKHNFIGVVVSYLNPKAGQRNDARQSGIALIWRVNNTEIEVELHVIAVISSHQRLEMFAFSRIKGHSTNLDEAKNAVKSEVRDRFVEIDFLGRRGAGCPRVQGRVRHSG